ncbi:MAG: tRNA (adenosine(37)-N6)-threonylcarbamoyltransferase complex ATPase subunit type 1 TsaE [Planctomycetota bacterium]
MVSPHHTLHLPADPAATERLGAWLGQHLRPGNVVGLVGELGVGKTTLVRGMARGLGTLDPEAVCSPTYLLVIEHPGRVPLLHADAYLPAKLAGFLDDGGLEYLLDPAAVAVVEWAQRVAKHLPERTLWVELSMSAEPGRSVRVRCQRAEHYPFLAELPKMWAAD